MRLAFEYIDMVLQDMKALLEHDLSIDFVQIEEFYDELCFEYVTDGQIKITRSYRQFKDTSLKHCVITFGDLPPVHTDLMQEALDEADLDALRVQFRDRLPPKGWRLRALHQKVNDALLDYVRGDQSNLLTELLDLWYTSTSNLNHNEQSSSTKLLVMMEDRLVTCKKESWHPDIAIMLLRYCRECLEDMMGAHHIPESMLKKWGRVLYGFDRGHDIV